MDNEVTVAEEALRASKKYAPDFTEAEARIVRRTIDTRIVALKDSILQNVRWGSLDRAKQESNELQDLEDCVRKLDKVLRGW